MITKKDFKGYIHDVGGPTGNFHHKACKKQEKIRRLHQDRQCLFPKPCENLIADHRIIWQLLRKLQEAAGGEEGLCPFRNPF